MKVQKLITFFATDDIYSRFIINFLTHYIYSYKQWSLASLYFNHGFRAFSQPVHKICRRTHSNRVTSSFFRVVVATSNSNSNSNVNQRTLVITVADSSVNKICSFENIAMSWGQQMTTFAKGNYKEKYHMKRSWLRFLLSWV